MASAPILRHLHLPSPTSYHRASRIQTHLVNQFLAHKASPSASSSPPPTIITFSPYPIYTTGRRDLHRPITAAQHEVLSTPLHTWVQEGGPQDDITAEIHQASRGGQITFHGPGQAVIYPILDLRSTRWYQNASSSSSSSSDQPNPNDPAASAPPPTLSPRCYVSLLEHTTMRTLAHYSIASQRTADPGVWASPTQKLAALGVHLRRFVGSHGVGLNVSTDLRWFERIVACGLEGKSVTSMVAQREALAAKLSVHEVARRWVGEFAQAVGLGERVVEVTEEEVMAEEGERANGVK